MPFHRPIPESKPPEKSSGMLAAYIETEKLLEIAFVLPAAVAIGWVFGAWADHLFHQSWIMIAGVIFGSVSGLTFMIRMAMDAERKSRPGIAPQNGTGKESTPFNHDPGDSSHL